MTSVYLLRHMEDDREDGRMHCKTIGVYSTLEKAQEAVGRFHLLEGFFGRPDMWWTDERVVDEDGDWQHGFDPKTHQRLPRE